MAKALEKYGIQMPSFGKIGGILASEIAYDEAASEYRHLCHFRTCTVSVLPVFLLKSALCIS